ncbi:hypothetical protein G3N58_17820 [Paraburkholderia sp. Ac-20342]|uniref:hypothetical protein n=1 Tax=Paraburkholderia sp. Ac-20342 TaxID=2703889 RepID=UPI0019810684|nr:hypothetical protein [Paraburkholderia sp. Ac-20342]MBN3848667.1 hypothetical protein [Paraburkholderia sp. Ac-20342]
MSEIKDGGPAFPTSTISRGISIRDYFAAKAMQAVPMPQGALHDIPEAYDRIAQHAYKMADAMLRARESS